MVTTNLSSSVWLLLIGLCLYGQIINAKRYCGGPGHSAMTRPCSNNDTDCGTWGFADLGHGVNYSRWWTPHECHYREVTPENARKCLGNRTIACIGDSQIRDICQAVVSLLLGKNYSGETKFDYNDMDVDGTIIPDFPFWSKNVPPHNHNGYIFPKPFNNSYASHKWQVQMWSLFRREFMQGGQARDVISHRMVNEKLDIRKIDFLLWNHGLHDWGWFDKPPRGAKFYENIFRNDYLRHLSLAKMPTLWVSMNKNCLKKLRVDDSKRDQHGMVDDANLFMNAKLLEEKIPYWDANAVLRTNPESVCEHSGDGVHVKMYVDEMRAKMLFNHLCDHHWVWNKHPLKHFVNS